MRCKMNYYIPKGKAEKKLWDEANNIFEELLNDLKSKNMIRLTTIKMDRERLVSIWQNSDRFGKARNEFLNAIYPDKAKEFSEKSGLADETIVYVHLTQLVSLALIDYESVFKTSLLFFLEEEQEIRRDMTLTQLLKAIVGISPIAGKKLKKLIDTDLRNSLAHGTFWFKHDKMFLAKNSYLQEVREMSLADFMKESKRINVIAHAFTYTLGKKINEGFFKP